MKQRLVFGASIAASGGDVTHPDARRWSHRIAGRGAARDKQIAVLAYDGLARTQ